MLVLQQVGLRGVVEVHDLIESLCDRLRGEGVVGLEQSTARSFPADLRVEARGNLEDLTVELGVVFGGQVEHHWGYLLWAELLQDWRRQDGLGHSGPRKRRDDVGLDVVVLALLGQGLCKADQPHLGCRVVGLAEVTIQAGRRGGVHDTAIVLFTEIWPCGLGDLERTVGVHIGDQLEVQIGHLLELGIAQDSGVVDHHMDRSKRLDGGLDDLLAVQHVVVVGNGLSAQLADLLDHQVGRFGVSALATESAAQVVHHHLGASLGVFETVVFAQAATCAGDDHDLVFEGNGHVGRLECSECAQLAIV